MGLEDPLTSGSTRGSPGQGWVQGPVLFLIFINDLPDNIRSSVRLFADDCVLYRSIHSLQDCLILQEDLTSLGQWEADWQMKFNVAKCHSMRVTRHQHHKQILFDYSLVQRTAARWTCRRWRNTSSVVEMLDELEWPPLEAQWNQSFLLLFHKIHCGAVSIEKDKYLTPAHCLKTTRSSHSAQYHRHQTYIDALKNSFSP